MDNGNQSALSQLSGRFYDRWFRQLPWTESPAVFMFEYTPHGAKPPENNFDTFKSVAQHQKQELIDEWTALATKYPDEFRRWIKEREASITSPYDLAIRQERAAAFIQSLYVREEATNE